MNHTEVGKNIHEHELLYLPKIREVMNKSPDLDLDDFLRNLSDQDKLNLAQKLVGGSKSTITVTIGSCNVFNSSLAVLLNEDSEKVADQLSSIPCWRWSRWVSVFLACSVAGCQFPLTFPRGLFLSLSCFYYTIFK